jgi:UDP-N-acetyl-D-mannosaminuronic acid transferase (WecB/TagA/CpsF family)
MQGIGLEWLYRVLREPRRVMRIFRATFVFIRLVVTSS